MKNCQTFSCVVAGSGTLPIRCAEILIEKNHAIRAVISTDLTVKKWALENDVQYFSFDENTAQELKNYSFDYLFSIVNEHILSEDFLRLPSRFSINYHDAPLPRYAGTHATAWALLNGEKTHGISWHLISETVDAGDILKQKTIEISDEDTTLTLNTKCYEAAIDCFAELVDELANETVKAQKQNLKKRTFFPRFKRLPNNGIINWNQSADEISRLVRALSFGAHPNRLGSAKIRIGKEFYIVQDIEISDSESTSEPATIVDFGENFMRVSAIDRELILRNLRQINGQEITISKLAAKFNFQENFRLENGSVEFTDQIEKLDAETCRHEKFWVEKLLDLEPAIVPFTEKRLVDLVSERIQAQKMPISSNVLSFLQNQKNWKTDEFLLAVFVALIARLNGLDQFDLGYINAKWKTAIAGMENLFVAELPARFEIDCLKNFDVFFARVKEQIETLEKHKFFARDIYARYPGLNNSATNNQFRLPIVIERVVRLDECKSKDNFELKLIVSETENECLWLYDREKISDETAKNLIIRFQLLLKNIAADSEVEIARHSLLTVEEREKILVKWNDNHLDYPKNQCIQNLFEAQVTRTPEATALIHDGERLSYAELNRRANRLANYLRKIGVEAETIVGVCIERSVEMIVGVLAILKAGGAYLPLDPNYPTERLQLTLEDSKAPFLLATSDTISDLDCSKSKIVLLDRDRATIAAESEINPTPNIVPNNAAYIIYTSGSTGKPKGVVIEHHSTVAFLHWALAVFTPEQLKGVLASTSICFDLSVYEMFAPLSCGGAIVLIENILYLLDAPERDEVTLINTVPSAITELLRINGVPASVKTVNLAGEPLKSTLVRQIYAVRSVEKVFDLYGPTEDTTYSTFTLRDTGAATIGRPIANSQAYILDRFLHPVPVGIAGELFLSGDGLARGYLNRPELTTEKFLANPFEAKTAGRMYRTGDLARFKSNGEIEYLGRIDNQVKIRGFRIELGEIESQILSRKEVRETVVVADENEPGDKRLVAYVVANKNQSLKTSELREFLKQKLPDYMVPSAFIELDEMPLTPNGKIDRKSLPAPATNKFDAERTIISHRDELEERLIKIWETILNVQPIGVKDDFFELGGHSLQAVRMFAEIEKTFEKNIPLATLFQAGTIEKLAEILRQDGWSLPESSLVPIQPAGTKPIFFCIHAKGGNVLFYKDLARHLGKDQPFYGVQARRLGGRQVGHSDLREMAEFYIKEIKTVQPGGPYFLGGTSFGGLAAFEMAQQLRAAGEKVALLALLDTGTPDYPNFLPETSSLKRKFYSLARRVQQQRDNLVALDARGKLDYAIEKLGKIRLKYRRKIRDRYKKTARTIYGKLKGVSQIPKSYIQLEDQIWRAGKNYQPEIYSGKITLFRAELQPLGIEIDPTLGWREYVGGELEIHEVPGHHGSIVLEPYVAELAKKMKICFEKAQAEAKQSGKKSVVMKKMERREVVGV